MEKEEQLLQKRFIELSSQAFQRNIVTFSDFLNLNEQNIFHRIPKNELYSQIHFFGGYEQAERQMIAFIPEALSYEYEFPISVLSVLPRYPKFAEQLTHRDYLGSILGLGIKRSKIGDIIVSENSARIFIQSAMEPFLLSEFSMVKHTQITNRIIELENFSYIPKYEQIKGTVASLRLDAILALVYKTSRSKVICWIEEGRVFANGKLILSNGYQIKEQDVISVRKQGRFQFLHAVSETNKGRLFIEVNKYI